MKTTIEVVPRFELYNAETGQTASAHGACPPGYEMRESGFTWKVTRPNGSTTYGLCRPPAMTREEADTIAQDAARKMGAEVK